MCYTVRVANGSMSSGIVWKSLGKCEVCNDQEAKYKCPRCEVKTCCLTCVNTHKKELECDGQRNKVAYKRISEFTNLDLLSDYRLLEETTRRVESYARDLSKHYTTSKELPINLYKLRAAARRRRTNLHFMPHNFTRSKANTTYFNWKEQLIYWRVEWIFPQADNIKCVGRRLLETEPLAKLVNVYLDPKECEPLYQDKLQYYQSAGLRGIVLLLKAEQKQGTRFYQLDSSLTLKDNLKEKTVIEFPTIYVVLKNHKDAFDILGPDEDDDEGRNGVSSNVNKNNLLFYTSDYSDNEDEYNTSVGSKKKYPKLDIPQYDVLIRQKS